MGAQPEGRVEESRALTGLRGVGAVLVMAHHLYLQLGLDPATPFLPWGLRKGYLGVDLFFVLSGFVMAMVYGAWFREVGPGWGRAFLLFLVRRVARVWPAHAAVLLVLAWLRWMAGEPGFSTPLLLGNLAMVQAWGFSMEINPPAWSISTEFAAYLAFPLLAALVWRGAVGPLLCVAGVGVALWACLHFAPPIGGMRRGLLDIYFNYSALPVLRCLAGFVVGMLAWRAGQMASVQAAVRRPFLGLGLGGVALLAMAGMMLGRVNDLLILLAMPVIVLGLHHGRGPVRRALGRGVLHGLGVLSYGIYLVHLELMRVFPFGAYPMGYMLPAYLAATLGLAAVLHVVVEWPARRGVRAAGEWLVARRALQDRPPWPN